MRRLRRALQRLQEWRRKDSHSGSGFDDTKADAFSIGSDLILLTTFIVPALGVLGAVIFGWPF